MVRWMLPLLAIAGAAHAQLAALPPTEVVTFEATDPRGGFDEQNRRLRRPAGTIQRHDPGAEYDIRRQSFKVYRPEGDAPQGGFALLVWVSPGDQGLIPASWKETLRRRGVLVIAPEKAGNDRFVWHRIALAVDAASGARARWAIDEDRVWVGGFSGGGRLASTLGHHWPDVFRGGIYAGGVNHFKALKRPGSGQPATRWPKKIPKPKGKLLARARRESRHVLICGATDFNGAHARAVARDLKRSAKYRHVTWLEMPDRGHVPPDGAWLERAVAALLAVPKSR